jgi:pimeloyl-ACP methyl ester carboxylesterase
LADFACQHHTGAGVFLLGHSYGGKLALRAAADQVTDLIGLDVSGVSHQYAVDLAQLDDFHGRSAWGLHWGQLSCYPPGAFRLAAEWVCKMPSRERLDALAWPQLFSAIAGRIQVPVRFTYAEHERWWRHDEESLAAMTGTLCSAPRVVVDRLPRAGHNISLGWAARAYHLRALAFLEECLAERAFGPIARR